MAEAFNLLVIDDETVIRESIRRLLSAEGFAVQARADAESGLALLREAVPDVVFVDLKLPKQSGMEFLDVVQKEFPQVAAIVMTGYSTLENAVASLQHGALDFLPKPFGFEELLSTAQRAGRFVRLPQALRRPGIGTPPLPLYRLGMWAWAQVGADDTALVGVTDLFQRLVGRIVQVDLCVPSGEVHQGSRLVELGAADQLRHTVWSALSGRVIERNHQVEADPSLLNRDPWGSGWLLRIIPDRLKGELPHLLQI